MVDVHNVVGSGLDILQSPHWAVGTFPPQLNHSSVMALALRRLAAAFGYTPQDVRALSQLGFGACYSSIVCSDLSGEGVGAKPQDSQSWSWPSGGGSFHKSASIDPTAFVEFGAVVHSKSVVGEPVRIGSGAVIGPGVSIGQSTEIGYNVSLSNCTKGDSCIIHNGACIDQDGYAVYYRL